MRDLIVPVLCGALILQSSGLAQAAAAAPRAAPAPQAVQEEQAPTPQEPPPPRQAGDEEDLGERLRDVWQSFREALVDRTPAAEPEAAPSGGEAAEPPSGEAAERGDAARAAPVLGPADMPPMPPSGLRVPAASGTPPAAGAAAATPPTEASLLPGPNLVSIPNPPDDPDPAAVLAPIAGQYAKVFAYDGCDAADPWKVYDPADPPGSDLAAIDHKLGLWVDATAATNLPSPGSQPAVTSIDLCTGWNLVGYPLGQPRPVPAALASIAGKYARVFGFDLGDPPDAWEVFDPAAPGWANDLTAMTPGRGYWVLATEDVTLDYTNQGAGPEVELISPAALAEVASIEDVIGTVRSDLLERWEVSYRASGTGDPFVGIATGNVPVEAGPLGTFDPSLLLNGMYDLRLEAFDFQGQGAEATIPVAVDGDLKVGMFTLSFSDLLVSLAGLDIEVLRTYDSRDKREGDFGVGWALEIKQGSYRNNVPPGDGWEIVSSQPPNPFPCVGAVETQSHLTTIRLSDEEVYRFRLEVFDTRPNAGGCFGKVRFAYVEGPDPAAALDVLGNTDVLWGSGTNFLFDPITTELYEPRRVRLTTRRGRQFDLSLDQGVTNARDPNGNEIEITPTSISHSSGVAIALERDARGRITSIVDPAGKALGYQYDASGDLVSFTDRAGNTATFTYDGDHNLLDLFDPLGNRPIRNDYDEAGRLISTTDASGKSLRFERDLDARREVIRDRLGFTRVLEYDPRGNVTREIDQEGNVTVRTFDAEDNLLTQTDALDRTTAYTYTAANDLASVTDPLGNVTSMTYDGAGRLLTRTDGRGNTTSHQYDAAGNLTQTTDALDNVASFTYDGRGNRLTETDVLGHVTTHAYDGRGNLIQTVDPLGNATAYTYDAKGNRLTETRTRTLPAGGSQALTTAFVFDELDRLVSTVHPDGSTESLAYDSYGQVVSRTDALGRSTSMSYDDQGRLETITYADGTTETTTYDAAGRVITRSDRADRVTSFTYDGLGNLLTTTFPDGTSTASVWDGAGQLVARTDERSNTTTFEYDDAGRRNRVVDAMGRVTATAYDAAGNETAITDARGNVTTFAYDELNRRTVTTYPDTTTSVTGYDDLGRLVSETDQAGRVTQFGFDALGRLTSVTDALNQVTSYTYDEVGNQLTQTDARGRVTTFGYDELGRRTSRTLPDGSTESMSHSPDGVIARTDFLGRTTTFAYDVNSRLIGRGHPDGTSVAWSYTPTGRRASYTDARGTTTFAYDQRDRLTLKTTPDGRTLAYGYDAAGNRTGLTATVGAAVFPTAYTYDSLNRLETVTDPTGQVYTHAYDNVGNRTSLVFPNGVSSATMFDPVNRLSLLAITDSGGANLQSFAHTLGPTGRRTRIDESAASVPDRTVEFVYDSLYRLNRERVTDPGAALVYQEDFAYDPVGNRTLRTRDDGGGPTATAYTYDARDRLLSEGATAYGWDANGDLSSVAGEGAYAWDTQHRLTSATLNDGTQVVVHYDPDGNRVRTETTPPGGSTETTDYLVDDAELLSHVVVESDASGGILAHYTRGNELLALWRPALAEKRFFHADGIGSVRLLTDSGGAVTDRYTYSAFGTLESRTGSDPQPYRFTGEPFDPNLGFQYHRARWLDTGVGRFVSTDPFGGSLFQPISLHRYVYAAQDPVNRIDPSGRFFRIPDMLMSMRIMAHTVVMIAAPLLHLFNRLAFRLQNIGFAHYISRALYSFSSGVYRAVGLNPRVVPLHAGNVWQALVDLPMRLIGALPYARIGLRASKGYVYPDWIWHAKHIIDAKIQHISVQQFTRFVQVLSRQGGGSVNYVNLIRPDPAKVEELKLIAAEAGNVAVRVFWFIPTI